MALIAAWSDAIGVAASEAGDWRDAARFHDALRDADEALLRRLVPDANDDPRLLHGPAAAAQLVASGERRSSVLDAVRYHTIGHAQWDRTGRALYMADYLEPGRPHQDREHAVLASMVPEDFDGVFRRVVQLRLAWAMREGSTIHTATLHLWNSVR